MLFEVEKLVEDVMGPQTDKYRYESQPIIDVLMEYVTSNASEDYISFALEKMYRVKRKVPELITRAKKMRDDRAKSDRLMTHDSITDQLVMFDGKVSGVGGYSVFITPYSKLYDELKDNPKLLVGRVFLETIKNGEEVHYLRVISCSPMWVKSESSRQFLRNLEYRLVKFNRIKNPLLAAEAIQMYRNHTGK